jgi:hypothetical protein
MTKNGLDENYSAKITTVDFLVDFSSSIEHADEDVRFSSRTQVRKASKPDLPALVHAGSLFIIMPIWRQNADDRVVEGLISGSLCASRRPRTSPRLTNPALADTAYAMRSVLVASQHCGASERRSH